MNNLAKGAAGLASAGTICTGGYFVCKHCIFTTSASPEPNIQNQSPNSSENKVWKSLDISQSNYEDGTMGKIYGGNLLDPFDEGNVGKWTELHQKMVDDENKASGNNSYQREITSLSFQASVVSNPFAKENDSANTTLNKVCKNYYGKQTEGKEGTDNTKIRIGGDDWKAFWMLCSEWNPKMLDANSYAENSIGKIRGDELLSANGQDNEELWKKKNQDFFGLTTAPTENIFKTFYEENKGKENPMKLKDKCGEMYSSTTASEQGNNPNADEIVKYCSMQVISNQTT